ncbi:MAG TPA: flagellar motor protein MotD [Nevskiaceae bacterium]|nr:flagellar motor protein MotD [Nevskiaceae bacterium]
MARKGKHEDHINHEAWAIPYGDLITLLLAFFVVMYSISSVNEGKYRVLSDSLSNAFGGPPKSLKPVQVGPQPARGAEAHEASVAPMRAPKANQLGPSVPPVQTAVPREQAVAARHRAQLAHMAEAVEKAMQELVDDQLILIRREAQWLEVEIKADILFASGSAALSPLAEQTLDRLGQVLAPFPNPVRVEGHTDDQPIATALYPSNWELSAARAATVVRRFSGAGIAPTRLAVEALGEFRPVADNRSLEGRNRNRRVLLVILATESQPVTLQQQAAAPPTGPAG